MAVDLKSIFRLVFGLSVIIASDRATARPQRADFEFLPAGEYNCSSLNKNDWPFDKKNREARLEEYYIFLNWLNFDLSLFFFFCSILNSIERSYEVLW